MNFQVPEDSPFAVDAVSGEIRTRAELDFEEQVRHCKMDTLYFLRVPTGTIISAKQSYFQHLQRFIKKSKKSILRNRCVVMGKTQQKFTALLKIKNCTQT